jgi:hypothetical protein
MHSIEQFLKARMGGSSRLSYANPKEVENSDKTFWCVIFAHKQALDVSIIHDFKSFAGNQIG